MKSREIERREWQPFVDSFSRQHDGWLVSIAEERGSGEHEWLARDLPLHGIVAEVRHEADEIFVFAGNLPPHVGHAIAHPVSLTIEENDDGAAASLTITDIDGNRTYVEFRSPIRPELVDGMAPQEARRR